MLPLAPDPPDPNAANDASANPDASLGRRFSPDARHCEICGFPLVLEHHCKIICPNCGFTRDCSDT